MKYILTLALASASVFAQDEAIEGGFGVKLGEPVEARLVNNCQEQKDMTLCLFNPDETHPLFSRYLIGLDPKESKVVFIEASTFINDGCTKVQEVLGQAYSDQYYNFQNEPFLWGYGDKIASLKCEKSDDGFKLSMNIVDAQASGGQ